jgi:magnesium transporter
MMIRYIKAENGQIQTLQQPEKGCWIHLYGPFSNDETQTLSRNLDIDLDFINDSLDIDERSRFESFEGVDLIVLKTAVKNESITDSDAFYLTIPIGIMRTQDYLVTVSPFQNSVIDFFLQTPPRNFSTYDQEQFILQLFDRNVLVFHDFLRVLNNKRYVFEKELQNSSRNEDLTNLLNIQKSLIYFVTNLRSNDLLMMKMQRANYLRLTDEEKVEQLKDIIIDNSQALEMSEMYSNILNGTMDTFASIISNNLNGVMKRLTSVTIVLMIPTLIASFYGMNVDHLPFAHSNYSFIIVFSLSILISMLISAFFILKKWF